MSIQSSVITVFRKQVAGVNAKALTSALERKDVNAALTAIGVAKLEDNVREAMVPEVTDVFAESGRKENLSKDRYGVCALPTARSKVLPAFGERERLKKAKDRLTKALEAHRVGKADFEAGKISESTLTFLKQEVFNAQVNYDKTVADIDAARAARKGITPKKPAARPPLEPTGPAAYGPRSEYYATLKARIENFGDAVTTKKFNELKALQAKLAFEESPHLASLVSLTRDVDSARALADYVDNIQVMSGRIGSDWSPRAQSILTDFVHNIPKKMEELREAIGKPDYKIAQFAFNPSTHTSNSSNVLGTYWMHSHRIEDAIGNVRPNIVNKFEQNGFYQRWTVAEGTQNVFLHEAGHHYHLSGLGLSYDKNFEWQQLYNILGSDYFKRKTSTYAGTDFMEAFTETLSMYILEPDVFEAVHERQVVEFFHRLKIKRVVE